MIRFGALEIDRHQTVAIIRRPRDFCCGVIMPQQVAVR